MIHSITLQNFKSFGEKQTVKLEPITVLVGPNNSGKSSFMSVGRFVANLVVGGGIEAIEQEGGESFFFHRLLSRLLGTDVHRWQTDIRFDGGGFRRVHNLAPTFLALAASHGITRALVAIDNDGGSQRCPEHVTSHEPSRDGGDETACRICWLSQRVPAAWKQAPHQACVVVPVQTLETWLLALKGHDFEGKPPEKTYDRPALKKKFYGRPIPPSQRCTELALQQLQRPDALDILRQRPSFQHFAEQLRGW